MYLRPNIFRSSFEKIPKSCSHYPSLKVLEAHIGENMQNTYFFILTFNFSSQHSE